MPHNHTSPTGGIYGAEHRTEQGYKALTAPARPFFSSDVIEHATYTAGLYAG